MLGEPTDATQSDLLASFENAQLLMPMPDMATAFEGKKERKKRTHDPNAPKRPLTPYFLYMQHARSIIANDLGAEAPKGAVQGEGQRRWANMGPHEKQVSRPLSRLIKPRLRFAHPVADRARARAGTTHISTTCASTTPGYTPTSTAIPSPRT